MLLIVGNQIVEHLQSSALDVSEYCKIHLSSHAKSVSSSSFDVVKKKKKKRQGILEQAHLGSSFGEHLVHMSPSKTHRGSSKVSVLVRGCKHRVKYTACFLFSFVKPLHACEGCGRQSLQSRVAMFSTMCFCFPLFRCFLQVIVARLAQQTH